MRAKFQNGGQDAVYDIGEELEASGKESRLSRRELDGKEGLCGA